MSRQTAKVLQFRPSFDWKNKRRLAVLEMVKSGEMKPEEADNLLRQERLLPLTNAPDPAKFDPMTVSVWNVLMTLAWIVWRTPEQVREHDNSYRDNHVAWAKTKDGWKPHRWLASIAEMVRREASGEDHQIKVMGLRAAIDDLVDKASNPESRLTPLAVRISTGIPQRIEANMWAYLAPPAPGPGVSPVFLFTDSPTDGFAKMTFLRADVMRLWRASATVKKETGKSAALAELVAYMRANPTDRLRRQSGDPSNPGAFELFGKPHKVPPYTFEREVWKKAKGIVEPEIAKIWFKPGPLAK